MGDVIGDINSRRGRMEGMDSQDGMQEIHACWYHFLKCLDMLQTCVLKHKVEELIQWNHHTMKKFQSQY